MKGWVLVTRSQEDLGLLPAKDLTFFAYPVLRQVPWHSPTAWEQLLGHLSSLNLVAFTSRHAPEPFLQQAQERALAEVFLSLPVAAVGETTAAACQKAGFTVALCGQKGAQELAQLILQRFPNPRVVFPCGREHRQELVVQLCQGGAQVFPLPVYAMDFTPREELPPLPPELPTAVVATSPRAAQAYWQATGGKYAAVPHLAFGTTTAAELARLGLKVKELKANWQELEELCLNL
jgi:uroporphyrinogen-III synthase